MTVTGCNPEQQMMYAGSMKSLVTEVGLSKVLVSVVNASVSVNANVSDVDVSFNVSFNVNASVNVSVNVNVNVNVDLYSASSLN